MVTRALGRPLRQKNGVVQLVIRRHQEALSALQRFAQETGILPALETAHALAWFYRHQPPGETLLILSGRGDKDLGITAECEDKHAEKKK